MAPGPTEVRQRFDDGIDEAMSASPIPTNDTSRQTASGDGISDTPEVRKRANYYSKGDDLVPEEDGRKLVGIDGNWYDVTDFISKHPGGPIIEHFIGKDATAVFHAQGHKNVLKYRKPVGTYTMKERHPADAEFDKLREFFKKEGYFVTDFSYYIKKIIFVFTLWATVFALVMCFDEWYMHYLGATVMAFCWQQCGFVMHDFMHGQVFKEKYKDRTCGTFFGTVIFGYVAHRWQDEHIIHHAMTNTVDHAAGFADPQMWELTWAQNEYMYPLFNTVLQYLFIKIQHFTFVPFVVLIGRWEILSDSYLKERRWYEWVAIVLHWTWMIFLLKQLPTWREVIIFYIIASWVEGIFHFQLILSHYCKEFSSVNKYHNTSWYVYQIASNMNIDVPWWQDWYYGGLNFHIEHHLFPKMSRKHLRRASPYIMEICKKHNIDYDMCSFTTALTKTLVDLKRTGSLYSLDHKNDKYY